MFDSYSLWCSCSYCLWQIYYQYEEGHRNLLKRNASSKECWSNTWTIRSEPHGRLVNKPVCLMVLETGFVWHLYYNNIQDLWRQLLLTMCFAGIQNSNSNYSVSPENNEICMFKKFVRLKTFTNYSNLRYTNLCLIRIIKQKNQTNEKLAPNLNCLNHTGSVIFCLCQQAIVRNRFVLIITNRDSLFRLLFTHCRSWSRDPNWNPRKPSKLAI